MNRLAGAILGESLRARALRSSAFTAMAFVAGQALRLASNLILTRLLFPEAFGILAIVMAVLQGLAMFSDVGITPSILHSRRGDDPAFLDTAWTIQVIRGFLLWGVAVALAGPLALFYGEPMLAQYLPVAGLMLAIAGFRPTRYDTANRHLRLGRVTALDLLGQAIGICFALGLALWLRSPWALVISAVLGAAVQLALIALFLPGARNRLQFERSALAELFRFGKWVFLSTVAGFFLAQGDKIVLGRYLSLDTLGVYNIGFFLASFALLLGQVVITKVLIPIYRERPPRESAANFAALRRMRILVTASLLAALLVLAWLGPWMVELLYDPRYAMAGGVVTLLAAMQVPQIIGLTYSQAALASGDSRRFFVTVATQAALMLAGLSLGFELAGLLGALLAQGAGALLAYPVLIWLARHQGAWDPAHDAVFFALGTVLAAGAIWMNRAAVSALGATTL
ncbi:MAG: oligosaccharide flippase family protein [Rhodosalinus sp.]